MQGPIGRHLVYRHTSGGNHAATVALWPATAALCKERAKDRPSISTRGRRVQKAAASIAAYSKYGMRIQRRCGEECSYSSRHSLCTVFGLICNRWQGIV